ncbi:hypothetical protein GIY11_02035 [Aerococcaceae bacterium DSM 109653]|uniref:Uncharacterized protein n=1 Tax=Fundicoccus ignavus TaxID=2664442 RepID=A0A844BKX9_9LACT|nr:hypothetical protein [Fundicoccus ignavus]MRI80808.1 hypothetical protein [Fundicoccus ignavus]
MFKINLDEKVRTDIVSNYSDSIFELKSSLSTFFEKLQEIYTKHNYSPLRVTAEFLSDFWEDKVQSQVTREVEIWTESEASIKNILKNIGAFGDYSNESHQVANELQENILLQTTELFKIDFSLKPISEAISMEKNLQQIFDEFNDAADELKQAVVREASQLKSIVSREAVDNKIYESFGYLTDIVFTALEVQMDNINKQLDSAYELIATQGAQAESLGQETASTLSSESESHAIETDFSDISHLFQY